MAEQGQKIGIMVRIENRKDIMSEIRSAVEKGDRMGLKANQILFSLRDKDKFDFDFIDKVKREFSFFEKIGFYNYIQYDHFLIYGVVF